MTHPNWTAKQLSAATHNPPLNVTRIRELLENGHITATKDASHRWQIPHEEAQNFLTTWENTWNTTQGPNSPYITSKEVRQRWGIPPAQILYRRRNTRIDKTDIYGETVYNRHQFENIAERYGYIETSAKAEGLDHCLHGDCTRLAPQQPEGHGFRFCPTHLPNWNKVRDNPQNRKITNAAEAEAA